MDHFAARFNKLPPADPSSLSIIKIVSLLIKIYDAAGTFFVQSDHKTKDLQGILLRPFTDLALHSCIFKAAAAQKDRSATQNHPDSFAATPLDHIIAGLRPFNIPV
jgi:hypothetical protein